MRALKDGSLRAHRDNAGRWRIEKDALEDWSSLRQTDERTAVDMTEVMHPDTELVMSIARLEATVEGLRNQLDQTLAERDRWYALATAHRPNFIERVRRSLSR